jgi:flagellar biosynthetic protein FliO
VAQYKKKIIVIFIVAALSGCMLAVCRTQLAVAESAKPLSDNTSSLFAKESNPSVRSVDKLSTKELFFKMMISVLLVVVLGVSAIYISKKFLPRITNLSGREIHIVETVHLGPRRAVHILKVGDKQLLIGSTNESITKLADVTDALVDLSSQKTNSHSRI